MSPALEISIGVQNTSNQSFTINAITADVFCDGYKVGNISSFVQQTIPRVTQTTVQVVATLKAEGIINQIIDALQTGNFPKEIVLKGSANVDNLQVPINQVITAGA